MTENQVLIKTPEEAIETIKSNMPTSGYQMLRESLEMAITALKEVQKYREIGTVEECQEARERRWIPVEERLPEELTPVLVTAYVPESKPGWDKRKTFYVVVDTDVYDPETSTGWDCFRDKVIAWRPLPEPYRAEERGR